MSRLLCFTLGLGLVLQVHANPGLIKVIERDGPASPKFQMVWDGLAQNSAFSLSSDMGVKCCNYSFSIENPVFPHR